MYYLSRCGGADLSRGQVRAAAVAGVVEAEEGVARARGHQLRGERVEAAGVVQPAVQRQPLRAGGRTFATTIEIIISDSVTMSLLTCCILLGLGGGGGPLLARYDPPGHGHGHLPAHEARHGPHEGLTDPQHHAAALVLSTESCDYAMNDTFLSSDWSKMCSLYLL